MNDAAPFTPSMKATLALEEAAQLALAIFGLYTQTLQLSWWLWPILFLAPDLGMLGYLAGPRAGAITYNLLHHKGVAIGVLAIGWFMAIPALTLAGLLLYAHSSFDRILGYGLKYTDSFQHTHLGMIGMKK